MRGWGLDTRLGEGGRGEGRGGRRRRTKRGGGEERMWRKRRRRRRKWRAKEEEEEWSAWSYPGYVYLFLSPQSEAIILHM